MYKHARTIQFYDLPKSGGLLAKYVSTSWEYLQFWNLNNRPVFHFYTDPDPWIRFVETRIQIRIRPKVEKYKLFYNYFLLITQQIIYYYAINENINSYEKKFFSLFI